MGTIKSHKSIRADINCNEKLQEQSQDSISHTFPPVYDTHSKMLILGSFPSVKSREMNFYYGHPQNRFWKVLAHILEVPVPQTIDEKKERIYLTETFKNHAYAYDMKGNFLKEETIYFPQNVIWMEEYFNKDNVLVFILPYLAHETNPRFKEADKNVCWVQDLEGNIIQNIPAGQYAMKVSISSQIYTAHLYKESPIYSFSIRDVNMHYADTIHHYNIRENKMYPVYTTNMPSNKLSIVRSAESPLHFYTCQTKYKDGTEVNPWNVEHYKMIQVDKKTKEARYVRIKNDLLGGIDVPVVTFLLQMKDDMLWLHYDNLLDLKEQLEEALETNTEMSEEVRKHVVSMKNTLTEDSNDVLVICKFKKQ